MAETATDPADGGKTVGSPQPSYPPPRRIERVLATRGARAAAQALLGVAVAIVDWPVATLSPTVGGNSLDGSWKMMMHLWGRQLPGLGPHVDFTYGPLGFLTLPTLWSSPTGVVSWLATLAFMVVFGAVAARALMCWLPWYVAIPTALLVVRAVAYVGAWVAAVPFVALFWVATRRPSTLRGRIMAASLLGLVAAVTLLCKFGDGVVMAVVALTAPLVWARRPWREMTAAGGTLLLGSFVGWTALTLSPGDFGHYFTASFALTDGYWVMSKGQIDGGTAARAVLLAVAVTALALTARERGRRLASVFLALAVLWLEFKHAFERVDRSHLPTFFVTAAVLVLVVGAIDRRRWQLVRPVVAALAVWAAVATAGPGGADFATMKPVGHFASELSTIASADDRNAQVRDGAAFWRKRLGVPRSLLTQVGSAPVLVDPWESVAGWAYHLHLRPAPVFQTYSAYTPWLDRENARFLAGPDAPTWILRDTKLKAVDGRFLPFESPAYQLAVLCNYRLDLQTPRWQLLEHTAPRCGPPVRLERVPLTGSVRIPPASAGTILAATFALPDSIPERLWRTAARETPPVLTIDGVDRLFLPPTAGDLHLLSAPSYAPLGSYLNGMLPARVMSLRRQLRGATVTFWSIPIR